LETQEVEQSTKKWIAPKKFAELAENPLVKNWLISYHAHNTKNEHLKRFGRLIAGIGYTPQQIVKELDESGPDGKKNGKALKQKVMAYCMDLVERGLTATANLTLSSFRSFLTAQEITTVTWTRLDKIEIVAVRTERKVPTKEQVYRMLDGIQSESHLGKERTARYKAMIWTAYQSGVRPGCLLKLRVGDIDLTADPPIPIKITPQLDSKITRPLRKIGFYWAFIGTEAKQAIKEYLGMREKFKQKLTPESPLFENFHQRGKPLNTGAWDDIVRRLGKFAGFKPGEISPHSFRHAFRKQVRFHVDDQVGTVLCGHIIKGSEEAYFDRKDQGFLRDEYAKVDWSREKTVTASQVNKLTTLLDKLGGAEKVEKLLETLAEEEQKPVKRIRRSLEKRS
jgi:integrase